MIILAVETSCDETSIAILKDKKVLSLVTVSQILKQKKYKGVFPTLAVKLHLKNIQKVLQKALFKAKIKAKEIDYIAYTKEPGLVICLQIGKTIAETLALYLNKPLIPINHLFGHIYASLIGKKKEWSFPALALIISGGHTQIFQINNYLDFKILGKTKDDAIGECLDKSAILLGYNYPGGPVIEKLAKEGKDTYKLTLPKDDQSCDFSFSGLKNKINLIISANKDININDLACSLQYTLGKILVKKLKNALNVNPVQNIIIGGGVIANKFLRDYLIRNIKEWDNKIKIFIPAKKYSTDNAAMIGICAYYSLQKN